MRRIACSHYTDLDDNVIRKATDLGLPIIGGTALELWSAYLGHFGVRKRSDNDLDFISTSSSVIQGFQSWVQSNIDPDKVQVDVMYIQSHDIVPYEVTIDGILTMSLSYLLWSKLTRHSAKDKQDIKWILSVPQLTDDEIVNTLTELGVIDEEISILTAIAENL